MVADRGHPAGLRGLGTDQSLSKIDIKVRGPSERLCQFRYCGGRWEESKSIRLLRGSGAGLGQAPAMRPSCNCIVNLQSLLCHKRARVSRPPKPN